MKYSKRIKHNVVQRDLTNTVQEVTEVFFYPKPRTLSYVKKTAAEGLSWFYKKFI